MVRTWFLFIALGCCGCSADSSPGSSSNTTSAATLERTAEVREIKVVIEPQFPEEKPIFDCQIEIRNPFQRTIHFGEVIKSCSCTGATLKTDTLAAGEATTLAIRVRWLGRTGPQSIICRLVEDGGATWVVTVNTNLYLRGTFRDDTVPFGMMRAGEKQTRSTSFLAYAKSVDELLSPVRFETSLPASVAAGEPITERLSDGIWKREYPLTVTVEAPREAGTGQVLIQATAGPPAAPAVFSTATSWAVRSVYRTSAPSVYVGNIQAAALPASRTITIRRLDHQPFRVQSWRLNIRGVRVTVAPSPDATHSVVTLTVDSLPADPVVADQLELTTDQADQQRLVIPVAISQVVPEVKR